MDKQPKNHCKRGHEYAITGVRMNKGQYDCKRCAADRAKEKKDRIRGHAFVRPTLADNYWAKVIKQDGCWRWTGHKQPFGYGLVRGGGGKPKQWAAHRVSYNLHKGEIPEGMIVRHTCDNPECTNPAHLILGTLADNVTDMMQRGRHAGQRVTHCPQGHPYSTENTRVCKTATGENRQCLECNRTRARERYRTKYSKAALARAALSNAA